MTFLEGVLRLMKSRKFWVLIASLVAVAGALSTGQISTWEAVQAIVAALSVYSAAIAYVDGNAAAADASPAVCDSPAVSDSHRRGQR